MLVSSSISTRKLFTQQSIVLGIFGIFLLLSPFIPLPTNMNETGMKTLAIIFFGIALWFTNIIPSAVTSMVVVVLFPLFEVLTFTEAASGLGKEVIWLIIAMLFMGVAVSESGMEKRLTYSLFSLTKGNFIYLTLTLIFVAFILTFIIPNAIGRLTVLLPIALGIIKVYEPQGGSNVSKIIMFSITYTPVICSVGLITGATGSIYAASLFETMLNYKWSYLYWMLVMLPATLLTLFFLWLILIWQFPIKMSQFINNQLYFEEEIQKLGPISTPEKKLIILYLGLILLWITQSHHNYSISMSAVLIAVLLFFPGIKLLEWKTAMLQIDWGIPLLFAAGFTIATAFQEGGIVNWASSIASSILSGISPLLLYFILVGTFTVIRIGFTNYTAMVASLLPVALTFALSTPFNPVWIGMICVVSSGMSFLFPSQSIATMTTYSLGYYSSKELIRVGFLLTFIITIILLLSAFFYWPFIGLKIY